MTGLTTDDAFHFIIVFLIFTLINEYTKLTKFIWAGRKYNEACTEFPMARTSFILKFRQSLRWTKPSPCRNISE